MEVRRAAAGAHQWRQSRVLSTGVSVFVRQLFMPEVSKVADDLKRLAIALTQAAIDRDLTAVCFYFVHDVVHLYICFLTGGGRAKVEGVHEGHGGLRPVGGGHHVPVRG